MLEGKIDARQFNRRLNRMARSVGSISLKKMKEAIQYVRGYMGKRKLRGQVLKVRTGRLRSSIDTETYKIGGAVVGRVGSNLKYARIHEIGGTIKAKDSDYLNFQTGGYWVKVKSVRIPKRPYIMPSLQETTKQITKILGTDFLSDLVTEGTKVG